MVANGREESATYLVSVPRKVSSTKTKAALARTLPTLSFNAVPLSDVVDFLRDVSGTNIFVNWKTLEAAKIDRNVPVSVNVRNVTFDKALTLALESAGGGKMGFRRSANLVSFPPPTLVW